MNHLQNRYAIDFCSSLLGRETVRAERLRSSAVRDSIAFASRMTRQRASEERTAARESVRAERTRSAAIREGIRLDVFRMRLRERSERAEAASIRAQERGTERHWNSVAGNFARAQARGASLYSAARQPAYYGMAAAGAAGAAAARGISGRMETDAAERSFVIFGSEPASRKGPGSTVSTDDIRRERLGWLNAEALRNAIMPTQAITAFTEMNKTGITGDKGRAFTKMILGAGAGMDMPTDEITKVMGKIAQNVPGVNEARMKNILNSMAISAATTAADPNQIVAGMRQGMGVFAMSNMSPEQLAAFTAVGAGAGIQEGKTGNFISELVSTVGRSGNEHGQRRKDLNRAARDLGFGNARGLMMAGQQDMAGTIQTILENFTKLEPSKKAITAVRLSMREWDDETLRFVNSIEKLKDTLSAVSDPRNKDFLDRAQDERMRSWNARWNRIKATFSLFWEAFGTGFDNIFDEISGYFYGVGRKFNFSIITRHVEAFLYGVKRGLGFETWTQMMETVFGKPDAVNGGYVKQLTAFGRGFAEGIREIAASIKAVATAFSGSGDPKAIGLFVARFVGLSAALVTLTPVVATLGALASGILALAAALRGAGAVLAFLGLGGGTAAAATGAGAAGLFSAATLTAAGGIIGTAFLATIADKLGILKAPDPSKGLGRAILEFLDPGLASRLLGGDRSEADRSNDSMNALRESIDENARILKQSFEPGNGSGLGGLIQKAAFTSDGKDLRDLKQMFSAQGARIQLAALGGGFGSLRGGQSGGGGGSGGGGSAGSAGGYAGDLIGNRPGSALPGGGMGRRGIIGGGGSSGPSIAEAFRNRLQRGPDGSVIGGAGKLKSFRNGAGGTPQGNGAGNTGPASTGQMMSFAMDQLRREGVPEAQLRQAAAHLVGQATMESGLNPNLKHDGGTGYGIYGARDPSPGRGRRTDMLNWLKANGYAPNSAEGQMRFMAREAMSGRFPTTKRILMGGGSGNVTADTNAVTREFEAPKVVNHRSPAVENAMRVGPQGPGSSGGNASGSASTGDFALGDSIAHGLQLKGAGGDPSLPGITHDGKPATWVLDQIKGLDPAAMKGKRVFLSSGLTNSMAGGLDHSGIVRQQIDALRAMGASPVLMGAGNAPRIGDTDAKLRRIAREMGVPYQGLGRTPDGLHPSNYGPILQAMRGVPARSAGSDAGGSGDGDVLGRMQAIRASGRVINEQCVSLAKAAVGVSGSVTTWRKGIAASAGTLKPGTPIATYLNPDGSQSDRYAGGGVGTMGANRDHAGVFNGYIRDKAGTIVGMKMADQWKGSGGVRSSNYMFGDRRGGMRDGNAYHAILGPDGGYLGGARNPMSASDLAPKAAGSGLAPTAKDLAASVIRNGPRAGSGGITGVQGGHAPAVHAPITINGANSDPETLANLVQKRVQESQYICKHEFDYKSV